MLMANGTLDIHDWLQRLNLSDYEDNFKSFEAVEELINYKEGDFKQLGIKNSSHRSRIIASLSALKGRYMVCLSLKITFYRKLIFFR